MKSHCVTFVIVCFLTFSVMISKQVAQAQYTSPGQSDKTCAATSDSLGAKGDNQTGAPIFLTTVPSRYRDWKVISVAQLETGKLDQLRAQLGNDVAIKAFREGEIPFPDGSMIVALHWNRVASEENNKVLGGPFPGAQSFVAGSAENIQFMVKDSKKYAATGGWGFGDFRNGKPADVAVLQTCFPCHKPAKARDFVFTRYAP
jgi:hypothetical protein